MIEGGVTPLHSYEELKAMGFQVCGGVKHVTRATHHINCIERRSSIRTCP